MSKIVKVTAFSITAQNLILEEFSNTYPITQIDSINQAKRIAETVYIYMAAKCINNLLETENRALFYFKENNKYVSVVLCNDMRIEEDV